MKDAIFIRSIPVLQAEKSVGYQRYFSSVAGTPGKVIRHMTPDFGVCEVDLDMQMSFLNAAPSQSFDWGGVRGEMSGNVRLWDVGRVCDHHLKRRFYQLTRFTISELGFTMPSEFLTITTSVRQAAAHTADWRRNRFTIVWCHEHADWAVRGAMSTSELVIPMTEFPWILHPHPEWTSGAYMY